MTIRQHKRIGGDTLEGRRFVLVSGGLRVTVEPDADGPEDTYGLGPALMIAPTCRY